MVIVLKHHIAFVLHSPKQGDSATHRIYKITYYEHVIWVCFSADTKLIGLEKVYRKQILRALYTATAVQLRNASLLWGRRAYPASRKQAKHRRRPATARYKGNGGGKDKHRNKIRSKPACKDPTQLRVRVHFSRAGRYEYDSGYDIEVLVVRCDEHTSRIPDTDKVPACFNHNLM